MGTLVALTQAQAEEIEAEIRRAEDDQTVSKHALRLLMQSTMPCGHSYGDLMMCDQPPFGCAQCVALAIQPTTVPPAPRGMEPSEPNT